MGEGRVGRERERNQELLREEIQGKRKIIIKEGLARESPRELVGGENGGGATGDDSLKKGTQSRPQPHLPPPPASKFKFSPGPSG